MRKAHREHMFSVFPQLRTLQAASRALHPQPTQQRSSRLADVRGPESWYPGGGSPGYHGGFIDLGPLGITAACGSYPHRYGHCGPGYGAPIDARSY